MRVKLYNAAGVSAARDFDFTAGGGSPTGVGGGWSLGGDGAPPSGGGRGGGGEPCVAPETMILISERAAVPIGRIGVGDLVWTVPEEGGEAGYHRVDEVEVLHALRQRVTFTDGRSFVCTLDHLLNIRGVWRKARTIEVGEEIQGRPGGYVKSVEYLSEGPVVRLSVPTAKTYLAGDGAWHHNTECP
jgi:hypothetical protein